MGHPIRDSVQTWATRQRKGRTVSHPSELSHSIDGIVEKIHQGWRNRLQFPLTKIPESYTRLQYTIALKLVCYIDGIKFGMCPLITFDNRLHFYGKHDGASGEAQEQFLVFVDNIEVMDEGKGIVKRVGGFIRLEPYDQSSDILICNSLYLSIKSGNFFFLDGLFGKNWEIHRHIVLLGASGEVPNDVVEARSQMVNGLTGEDAESWWNATTLMVLNCLKENLTVVIGDSWIFAFIKEPLDFRVEIADVLFGPC